MKKLIVRLDTSLHKKFKEICVASDRSMNSILISFIEKFVMSLKESNGK